MTPEEFSVIKTIAAGFGMGSLVTAAICFLFIKFFVSSYLSEKGKNLATREDIAEITNKVENVRAQYASLIEELKARHQLRLAAIDRRLQAHQEAFTLWREIMAMVHTENIGTTTLKCQDWWEKNCIYLEPTIREGFINAYTAARGHKDLVQNRAAIQLITENWTSVTSFPNLLFKAIQLPALTELEADALGIKSVPPVLNLRSGK
jgi:hypothetical protein